MKKIGLVLLLLFSVSVQADDMTVKTVMIHETPFQMEYAITPSEQRKGLAFRTEVPDKTGMLFLNHEARPVAFWMKNTWVPLDMIFFDEDYQITNIFENAQPMDETPIYVEGPIKGVIEVPAGSVKKYQLQIGDKVKPVE